MLHLHTAIHPSAPNKRSEDTGCLPRKRRRTGSEDAFGAPCSPTPTAPASCPVDDISATLLRVRQAEFASGQQAEDPDAWGTGAVEPGVLHVDTVEQQAFSTDGGAMFMAV